MSVVYGDDDDDSDDSQEITCSTSTTTLSGDYQDEVLDITIIMPFDGDMLIDATAS